MECFWHRGYEATSLRDLSDAMGLTAPSIYNAFGDKQQLFGRALERYLEHTTRGRLLRLGSVSSEAGHQALLRRDRRPLD